MNDTAYPDGIAEEHARKGSGFGAVVPLALLTLLLAGAVLGFFGGTGPSVLRSQGEAAALSLRVPTIMRSGLFFEMDIEIAANQPLADATISISRSLWHDMTINTTIPEPAEEDFEDGKFQLHFGAMRAGSTIALKVDGQINPDLFAGTSGEVALSDGDSRIAAIPLQITVLP